MKDSMAFSPPTTSKRIRLPPLPLLPTAVDSPRLLVQCHPCLLQPASPRPLELLPMLVPPLQSPISTAKACSDASLKPNQPSSEPYATSSSPFQYGHTLIMHASARVHHSLSTQPGVSVTSCALLASPGPFMGGPSPGGPPPPPGGPPPPPGGPPPPPGGPPPPPGTNNPSFHIWHTHHLFIVILFQEDRRHLPRLHPL